MTLTTSKAEAIFANAHKTHANALKLLAANDIRNAADQAWRATLQASDALILAWTGNEPQSSQVTTRKLRELLEQDDRVQNLLPQYFTNLGALYKQCSYLGLCEPIDDTQRLIHETITYIQDAENLALNPTPPSCRDPM